MRPRRCSDATGRSSSGSRRPGPPRPAPGWSSRWLEAVARRPWNRHGGSSSGAARAEPATSSRRRSGGPAACSVPSPSRETRRSRMPAAPSRPPTGAPRSRNPIGSAPPSSGRPPAAGGATLRPMDLDLPEETQEFRAVVREFADDVVAPRAEEMDRQGELPMDIVKQMGELGLFGLPFPEEYGGQGSDFLTLCVAIEELARVDSSIAITLEAAVGLGAMPIFEFGTEEQKRRWLVPMANGEILGAFGLTEPGGGSDAGATSTTASLDGGEWVINGSKAFITNSGTPITGLVTITAVTGQEDAGRKEISAIIVPSDTPGFEVGASYRKMGWHASDTHELSFNGCRVPQDH